MATTLFAYLFFFTAPSTTDISTLSLHDALPICLHLWVDMGEWWYEETHGLPLPLGGNVVRRDLGAALMRDIARDRKSTRLNSSHQIISYAVFCLKKKNKTTIIAI